jgi:hypothetical protein
METVDGGDGGLDAWPRAARRKAVGGLDIEIV